MKKPVIDYRGFRFRKLNTPEFSHLKLLLGWIIYLTLFALTENLIPTESCYAVHSAIDDIIPFCEIFVIPYVLWYALIFFSYLYFLLYNVESFKNLAKYVFILQMLAIVIYIIFPTKQELRPEILPRDNFFSDIVSLLYSIDTNTGVCPSLHVAISIAIGSVWVKERDCHIAWKIFILLFVISVCLSTMFIKQHSAIDFFAALPLCLLAEIIVFWKSHYYIKKAVSRIKS